MAKIENGQSSMKDIREIPWIEEQIKNELQDVAKDAEKTFYKKDTEKNIVTYKMNVVKDYLNKIKNEIDGKSAKEAWQHLVSRGNSVAWIMAVQIALGSIKDKNGENYDVGVIDGILKSK